MFLFFKASYTAKLPARAKIVLKVSSVTLEDSHPEDKLVFTRIRKQNHVQSKKVFPFYLSSFFYGKHGSECQNGNFLRRICFLPSKEGPRCPIHQEGGLHACGGESGSAPASATALSSLYRSVAFSLLLFNYTYSPGHTLQSPMAQYVPKTTGFYAIFMNILLFFSKQIVIYKKH
jgi:hypothetical protein